MAGGLHNALTLTIAESMGLCIDPVIMTNTDWVFVHVKYSNQDILSGLSKSPITEKANISDGINEYSNPLLNCFFLKKTVVIKTKNK